MMIITLLGPMASGKTLTRKIIEKHKAEIEQMTGHPIAIREVLEDLFAAAVNDAVRKIEANSQDKMSGVTAGMQLPPGMKLPF